jgi:hypothetical protein
MFYEKINRSFSPDGNGILFFLKPDGFLNPSGLRKKDTVYSRRDLDENPKTSAPYFF